MTQEPGQALPSARVKTAAWPWPWLSAWLPAFLLMALIFALSGQPELGRPGWLSGLYASLFHTAPWLMALLPAVARLDPLAASAGHLAAYGALAVALYRGVRRQWPDLARPALAAWGLALLYGLSDEWHQSFVPGRHADPWDLAVDGIGAAAALVALAGWQRRRAGQRRRAR